MPLLEKQLFIKLKVIGEGAYGKVYLVRCIKNESLCVLKQIDMKFLDEEQKLKCYQEA